MSTAHFNHLIHLNKHIPQEYAKIPAWTFIPLLLSRYNSQSSGVVAQKLLLNPIVPIELTSNMFAKRNVAGPIEEHLFLATKIEHLDEQGTFPFPLPGKQKLRTKKTLIGRERKRPKGEFHPRLLAHI